jgi:hypothetical protein
MVFIFFLNLLFLFKRKLFKDNIWRFISQWFNAKYLHKDSDITGARGTYCNHRYINLK